MAALADMGAAIRFEGGTAPLPTHDPQLLAQAAIWNLRTLYGDLDILYSPAGGGYEELLPNAEWVTIRSKELTNRAKDHLTLEDLRRFRDQQRERGTERGGHSPQLPLL